VDYCQIALEFGLLLGIYLVRFGGPDPCKPRTRSLHFQRKIAALFHADFRQVMPVKWAFFCPSPKPGPVKKAENRCIFPCKSKFGILVAEISSHLTASSATQSGLCAPCGARNNSGEICQLATTLNLLCNGS
jgi:hypothetical protein